MEPIRFLWAALVALIATAALWILGGWGLMFLIVFLVTYSLLGD